LFEIKLGNLLKVKNGAKIEILHVKKEEPENADLSSGLFS
jgi:hypothetical protein